MIASLSLFVNRIRTADSQDSRKMAADNRNVVITCFIVIFAHLLYVCYQVGFKDIRDRPARDVESRIAYLQLATETLRKQLFNAVCDGSSRVSDTGAWCLFSSNDTDTSYGYAMATHHFPADQGVARTIESLMKPGQRLLDLGCGIGQYGQFFKQSNSKISWRGYDGAINVDMYTDGFVKWADLTVPGFSPAREKHHWVMALEIGEHVPAAFEDVVIDNIDRNNLCGAVVSWAVPGQHGHQHINLRSNAWVINRFAQRGYVYDEATSHKGRESAKYGWFKNTFMIFRRSLPDNSC